MSRHTSRPLLISPAALAIGPRTNNQTIRLCNILKIPEPCQQQMEQMSVSSLGTLPHRPVMAANPPMATAHRRFEVQATTQDPDAIDLEGDSEEEEEVAAPNPDAIELDENNNDEDELEGERKEPSVETEENAAVRTDGSELGATKRSSSLTNNEPSSEPVVCDLLSDLKNER